MISIIGHPLEKAGFVSLVHAAARSYVMAGLVLACPGHDDLECAAAA
jgi:hypothetical protein